jgi:hypothetical protein
MTDTKPEALRLAELLDGDKSAHHEEAAAELRRLHEVNQELLEALKAIFASKDEGIDNDAPGHCHRLRGVWDETGVKCNWCATWNKARAAIAKAEGSK